MKDIREDEITKKIVNIINSGFTNDKKQKDIKEIEKKENGSSNYKEIIEAANQLTSGMISKQEFDEKLKLFTEKRDKQINSLKDKAIECAITELVAEKQQEHPEKTEKEIRAEITEKVENIANITEITNDKENFANITENENETFELGKKKEKAKLKKLYDYKVEGQISSGIKELDDFLKIIQPVINQAVIQPWRLIYKTSDKLAESKDALIGWDKERKSLKNSWKTLQIMGCMDKNNNIPLAKGNSGIQNVVAGQLHAHLLKEVNKNVYDDLIAQKTTKLTNEFVSKEVYNEAWSDQEKTEYEIRCEKEKQEFIKKELDKYKNSDDMKNGKWKRTKIFDTTQPYEPVRDAINKVFLDLIKDHCVDKNNVITEDGQKYMEGFMHIIDLFNRDDNSYIKNKYCEDLGYIISEAKKPSFGKPIWEKMNVIHEKMLEKQGQSDITKMLQKLMTSQGKT